MKCHILLPLKTQPYVVYISLEYIEETVSYVLSSQKEVAPLLPLMKKKVGKKHW